MTSSNKEDPLHRLYSTPTKATENGRWDVFQQKEKDRTNTVLKWGEDREEAHRIAAQAVPPSVATRTPHTTTTPVTKKITPRSSSSKKQSVV